MSSIIESIELDSQSLRIGQYLDNKFEILKKYNITNANYIGAGENGMAYSLSNNKVLKISTDDAEAMNAFYLKNNNLKYFVKYYDVKKYKSYYILILDEVKLLNDREIEIFNFLKKHYYKIKNYNDCYCYNILNYNNLKSKLFLFVNNKSRLKTLYKKYLNNNIYDIVNLTWLELLYMYYNVNNILIEAINNKLGIEDIVSGNLGYDNDYNLVMFDLSNYTEFNFEIEEI